MNYAFLMGSNGPLDLSPLKYAVKDAEKFTTVLGHIRCNYKVYVPSSGANVFELTQLLYTTAEACKEDDTFLCYFSGHGVLDRGSLFLLFENSKLDRLLSTALSVETLLLAVQRCPARNKLLVLDCCHAGAVAAAVGFKDVAGTPVEDIGIKPQNYLVLMAADRIERAREFEELKGSFLTNKLCSALDDLFHEADFDNDGLLSISDLKKFLEKETAHFNRYYHEFGKVPTPYFLGQQKGDFFLTRRLSDWQPYEFEWPNGTAMVVLPIRPQSNHAICLAKHPITNNQYRKFLEANPADPKTIEKYKRWLEKNSDVSVYGSRIRNSLNNQLSREFSNPMSVPCQEPVGAHYYGPKINELKSDILQDEKKLGRLRYNLTKGWWKGPFYPWREKGFSEPDKPVVCVNVPEAEKYCAWIDLEFAPPGESFIPYTPIWDLAAFGKPFEHHSPDAWLNTKPAEHTLEGPPPIGRSRDAVNVCGVADLFLTVWQWCRAPIPMHTHSTADVLAKLRGGSFLSDLRHEAPYWDANGLEDGEATRRSDIGFRIACRVRLDVLPDHVRDSLSVCPAVDFVSVGYDRWR